MEFKTPEIGAQFNELPRRLKEIVALFEVLAWNCNGRAVVTRCWDAVPGDSGVHEAHRGVDCRDQTDSGRLFSDEDCVRIVNAINGFYPRSDGKPTALHHSFEGGMLHFHFQIPVTP